MRILAIDYGKKRTGIAVTDPLQIIAQGLTTIPTHQLISFLKNYFLEEEVELMVVGYPKQNNGQPSENAIRIEKFISNFQQIFPDKKVILYDERFTSVLAQKAIIESGIGKEKRKNKALVDEISACIILQDFMNSTLIKQ